MSHRHFLSAASLFLAAALASTPMFATTLVSASAGCFPISAPNTGTTNYSNTIGVAAVNSVAGQCSSYAFSDLTAIKIGADNGLSSTYGANAGVDLYIGFYLTNPNVQGVQSFSMSVPLDYDITLLASSTSGFSGSAINMTTDYFNSFGFATSNDFYANNKCPSPLGTLPRCNAQYTGTFSIPVQAVYNGWSQFTLHVGANSQNLALIDALHTLTFGQFVLPQGVTVSYEQGVTGNPMNFQLAAAPSSGVPEPATVALLAPALLALGILNRRRKK